MSVEECSCSMNEGVCRYPSEHHDPVWRLMGRPGKFEGNGDQDLAERLYQDTLDGSYEDSFGSVDELGWYALIQAPDGSRGFIVEEDSQGFFTIILEDEDYDVVRQHFGRMHDEYSAWVERRP